MQLPWYFHGTSMGLLWKVHGAFEKHIEYTSPLTSAPPIDQGPRTVIWPQSLKFHAERLNNAIDQVRLVDKFVRSFGRSFAFVSSLTRHQTQRV